MSNLYKNKLDVEHLGIFFGTFSPMHLGHYQNVMQAKKETDACLVVVSGYEGDRGDLIGLDLNKRFRYIRELFADEENVYVAVLNEDTIPRYPDGWDAWLKEIDEIIVDATAHSPEKITWYVGEDEYKKELNERKPLDNVRFLDRKILPVSGTLIRDNPFKYWNYITRPFRRHFSTNILVMGTASGGKTTLVRDLARSVGGTFTDEYARRYEEESNVRDEELVANDFNYLASGQFDNNRKAIMSPANNGIFIADSNVLTTDVYAKYYLSEEDYNALKPSYELLMSREKWDLILFIPPVTQYVDDNFRDMSYSDDKSRWEMHQAFIDRIEDMGWSDKVRLLDAPFDKDSEYDNQGFYARYVQASEIIKEYLLSKYQVDVDNRENITFIK